MARKERKLPEPGDKWYYSAQGWEHSDQDSVILCRCDYTEGSHGAIFHSLPEPNDGTDELPTGWLHQYCNYCGWEYPYCDGENSEEGCWEKGLNHPLTA